MTPDEARAYLDRCRDRSEPAAVLYRPACGHTEDGVITRVSGDWVFVDYGRGASIATNPADLEPIAADMPTDMPVSILTPRCPLCDQPPAIVLGGGIQAFCGNDDGCTLIHWDMTASLDDNLMDAGVTRWEPTEGGSDV